MITLLPIGPDNRHWVAEFVAGLGNSAETFTYFKTRSTSEFPNHLVTLIALEDNHPVGYGHLDKENNVVWLGIAVVENHKGKGIGRLVMEYLINKARELCLPVVRLSVKKDNVVAIHLYEKMGFSKVSESGTNLFFESTL